MKDRILLVIPARYGSVRFPGKPLAIIAKKTLIQRVYEICRRVRGNPKIVVATDDKRIYDHVIEFGGNVVMTRVDHPSGTDRVAEVAKKFPCTVIINVQGDEPLLDPRIIERLGSTMKKNPNLQMGTLCHQITSYKDYRDPNVVKVLMDQKGDALYFTRSPIPYMRGTYSKTAIPKEAYRHLGIYAYRKDFLIQYVHWPMSVLEKTEKLEQLRALERGVKIRVLKTNYHAIGVDVPRDIKKVEQILKQR